MNAAALSSGNHNGGRVENADLGYYMGYSIRGATAMPAVMPGNRIIHRFSARCSGVHFLISLVTTA
jgi:hypothetical protein